MLFETGYFLQHKNADKTTVYQRFWLPYYTIPRIIRELQRSMHAVGRLKNYTIPRIIRELQLRVTCDIDLNYYTIPRIIRELQLALFAVLRTLNYTIPRIIRELQPRTAMV